MVLYLVNGVPVAGGFPFPNRALLHGQHIPPSHTCVMLTVAHGNIPAPLLLGDVEENSFLEKGKFFALPTESLMQATHSGPGKGLKMDHYMKNSC